MSELTAYKLPLSGLSSGYHNFSYSVGDTFFSHFEDSPIEKGSFEMEVELDKRPDLLVLHFDFTGKAETECDRCLATIQLPLSGRNRLLVKYGEEDPEMEEEDVFYIPYGSTELDIAPFVYEFIALAMPMVKVYECEEEEEPVCDLEMLAYLDSEQAEEEEEPKNNPFSEALKNFGKDN